MKKLLLLLTLVLSTSFSNGCAQAYDNEVGADGGLYYWKVAKVQKGTSPDLATAITNCMEQSTGAGREIHVLVGGSLSKTVGILPDVKLFGHGNTLTVDHGGYGVHGRNVSNIEFYDMTFKSAKNMVFRLTGCNNIVLSGINIDGGFIGMRIDSRASRPWEATNYNLKVTNCRFENLGSHGLETYSIDGVYVDGIVARNNGESGVLFNNSRNGFVGTVDAYRCSRGGGYAGLRFANGNENFRVKYLRAIECGRGFFSVTGSKNIVVEEVYIRDTTSHAILIQHSNNVGVNSGSYNGHGLNHYTSANSWILATDVAGLTATPPVAPTGLTATDNEGSVSLKWPTVNGATGYLLQRATTSDGPYFTIAYPETTSFTDRDTAANSTYYYKLKALNSAGPGAASPAASAAVSAFTPVVDPDLGVKLHLPFDGSGADSTGGSASAIAGPAAYIPGVWKQALNLNGSANFVTLPQLSGAEYREFTAAAWVWPTSAANFQRIFDLGKDQANYMMLNLAHGTLRYEIRRNDSLQVVQAPALPLGQWSHVAVTLVGNRGTIYVNGAPVAFNMFINTPAHFTLTRNYLGKSQFPDPLFNGRMDDFRLYNRGLSTAEMSALVMSAPPVAPTTLTAGGFGTRVNVQWSGLNASSYNIKRAEVSGGPYTAIARGVTGTTYSDTGVVRDKTYYYVVTASNAQGESGNSNQAVAVTSDLVAHLKFDETGGNTAADSSGNSWGATLHNEPKRVSGVHQNAVSFVGASSQHAALPTGVVSGLNDFTISAWIRVSSLANWARVFDLGTGTDNYMFLTPQSGATGRMQFAIRTPSGGEQVINSSTTIPLNAWAHVAITGGGNTGSMYLNGKLVGTNAGLTLNPSSLGMTTQNYLGRSQFPDPHLDGAIDDLRIYSRALSAEELKDLINRHF
jgi:hypothetical protein